MLYSVDLTLNDTFNIVDDAQLRSEFIENIIHFVTFDQQFVKFNGINLNIDFKSEKRYKIAKYISISSIYNSVIFHALLFHFEFSVMIKRILLFS